MSFMMHVVEQPVFLAHGVSFLRFRAGAGVGRVLPREEEERADWSGLSSHRHNGIVLVKRAREVLT